MSIRLLRIRGLLLAVMLSAETVTVSAAPESPATGDSSGTARSIMLNRSAEKAFAAGNLQEAVSLYGKALEITPGDPRLLVSLAAVETRNGNLKDSENHLRQALRSDLRNGPAWQLLGMNCLEQKRDEEAFAALVQAVLNDPDNPRAHHYLGISAGRKGWGEVSEQELRRAVELDPNYADANYNLAVLYLRRTPPLLELARRHYQRALDLGTRRDPSVEAQFAANGSVSPAPPVR